MIYWFMETNEEQDTGINAYQNESVYKERNEFYELIILLYAIKTLCRFCRFWHRYGIIPDHFTDRLNGIIHREFSPPDKSSSLHKTVQASITLL